MNRPPTEHTGPEVRDLDPTRPVDAETSGALNRTFVDRHVLMIGDQKFTPPHSAPRLQLFGELQRREDVLGYPQMYFLEPADLARQTLHFRAEEREGPDAPFASAGQYLMRTLSITTLAELRRGRRESSDRLGRDQALVPQLRPRSGTERRPGAAAPSIASGIDAAAADAGRCCLYTSAAFLCADRKPAESADRNRFSTELSADSGDNGDQYLV